jgi:hypothetical protein
VDAGVAHEVGRCDFDVGVPIVYKGILDIEPANGKGGRKCRMRNAE